MPRTPPNAPVRRKTLLVLSQVYVPDPASVGQHMADVAAEMARRGYRVNVYASARGYENPQNRYPARETIDGVHVRRLPFASFGKRSLLLRVLGTAVFQFQCLLVGLFAPADAVFFSTSPPLIGIIATIIHILRGVPIAYWAMDLNPDQLIALGKLRPASLPARLLEAVNRVILRESALIIALDRFMAGRLEQRGRLAGKMLVIPPWPHEDHLARRADDRSDKCAPPEANPFRVRHGLARKFVIMYSGNHSPSNPLTTLLEAAVHFKQDDRLRFVFVGGGSGKREVEQVMREHGLTNMLSLPYQPLTELNDSLSAADVHVVALGEKMVGIIHPCKVYGAMAVARPVLYFGPRPSHVTDLLDQHHIGIHVRHGDVAGAVQAIEQLVATPLEQREQMGTTARAALNAHVSQRALCATLCDRMEAALFDRPECREPVPGHDQMRARVDRVASGV